MKICTDKEYELIELIKGQPMKFSDSVSARVLNLMDNIRVGLDKEIENNKK